MKSYAMQMIKILLIIILSTVYVSCGNSNNCWVCKGDGINDCIACESGKTQFSECSFCDRKGNTVCTFCDGKGNLK